ncbi:MAG: c-type cytochrome domain-containing protein, partial [Verrucomicrobiales bacterium]
MRKYLKSVFPWSARVLVASGLMLGVYYPLAAAEPAKTSGPIPIKSLKREKPVDFSTEVLPLFKKSCLACHNASDAKGEFIMETPQTVLKGGDTGAAIIPGKGSESLLIKLASHQDKPYMPPRNNKAGAPAWTPEELGLIELWINQGATGVVNSALGPVNWQPLPPGLKAVGAVALSNDGQYAAASRANQIFIYNLASGEVESRLTDPELIRSGFSKGPGIADKDIIQSLAFSPDNRTLASGAYRSLKLWQKPAPQELKQIIATNLSEMISLATSADGQKTATGHADGSAWLWDNQTGKPLQEFKGHTGAVTSIDFSPDGALLATGSRDRSITLWNIGNPAQKQKLETPAEVTALTWAGSTNALVSGGADKIIRIWQIAFAPAESNTGTPVAGPSDTAKTEASAPATEPKANPVENPRLISGLGGEVTSLDYLAAGKQILSGSKDGSVQQWNFENGQLIRKLEHGGEVTDVAFRPDGKRVASSSRNNNLKLWNADDGKMMAEIKGDHQAELSQAQQERDLTFARNEATYHKSNVENAEKQEKAETEALKK